MDNQRILNKYQKPNADGQIATHCIHFNNSFKSRNQDTCLINYTYDSQLLQECEILNGQFCDCYKEGNGYEI